MHINKLTDLHKDDFAKKAVPVSETKTCQNAFRVDPHVIRLSVILSHGRSQVT